jgi:hypothetical protein
MLLRELGAEERDRADILERLRLYGGGDEAFRRVVQHDQASVRERHRPEEAGFRVRYGLDLAGRHLVAEDVGHAGVVARAVEILAIAREDEGLRHRLAELELAERPGLCRQDLLEGPHAQELISAHLDDGSRQEPAVG